MLKKLVDKLDIYILAGTAAVGAIFTVISLTGALGREWIEKHQGETALALALLSAVMVGAVVVRLEKIASMLASLKSQHDLDTLETLSHLRRQVDGPLDAVCGDYLDSVVRNMQRVIRERTLELNDLEAFRRIYRRSLSLHRGATLYATSSPTHKFFWSKTGVQTAMQEFLKAGGKIERTFFLDSVDDLQKPEVRSILSAQDEIGVEVYTVPAEDVSENDRQYVLVESNRKIGWKLELGPGGEIACETVTTQPGLLDRYMTVIDHLAQLDSRVRFRREP